MRNVILNLMMMGVASSLIMEDVSAISFGKSRSRTAQVQEEDGVLKRAARKTKDMVKKGAKKAKKGFVNAKAYVKTTYNAKKDQARDKSRQKKLTQEHSPINTMFESKAEVEYNLKYLNDVRKNLKTSANSIEQLSNSSQNAFVVKSWLFELSSYVNLCDKFAEHYLDGMSKLKKAQQYDDANYNLAMNAFTTAYEIIKYAQTQRDVINYLKNLVTVKNLKSVSEKDASNISKKLSKLRGNLENISADTEKCMEVMKAIHDQTIDDESLFKSLESQMLSCLRKEKETINKIPDMIKKVAKTVNNYIDTLQKQIDDKMSYHNSTDQMSSDDEEDFDDMQTTYDSAEDL